MEIDVLFLPRGQALWQGGEDHVEVELVETCLVLCPVHGANAQVDSETRKTGAIRQQNALQTRIDQQYLERERAAFAVLQTAILQVPASLGEQGHRFAQRRSWNTPAIGCRQAEGFQKQGFRQLLAIGSQIQK